MIVVGIDEVGRGSWAGPLCVAAVALDDSQPIKAILRDSKVMTAKQRRLSAHGIRQQALAIGVGWIGPEQLDKIGLSRALRMATASALAAITIPFDKVIIDGTVAFSKDPRVQVLPKADSLVPAVSAASIVAKVARDGYMHRLATLHPHYGFDHHVGYGTAVHQAALQKHGPCVLHRFSFVPIKALAI